MIEKVFVLFVVGELLGCGGREPPTSAQVAHCDEGFRYCGEIIIQACGGSPTCLDRSARECTEERGRCLGEES